MKYSEKLKQRYLDEIRKWNWESIVSECDSNPHWNESGEVEFSTWIGSTTSLFPSGKIYTFWTTNQTIRDMIHDQAYGEALEEVAEENGLCVSGDSGDIRVGYISGDDVFTSGDECFYYLNRCIAESEEELKDWMDNEGYYPNVFYTSDHGNLSLYQMEE